MPTATTKTFKSGNSEAVRLPRELAFGIGTELTLERSGDLLKIYPKANAPEMPRWKQELQSMVAALESMPKPSSIQARDEVEIPEREVL